MKLFAILIAAAKALRQNKLRTCLTSRYVGGGEGYLDVFQESAGRFGRTAHVTTAPGARTSLIVPSTNQLYLAVPHRGSQNAEIRVYEAH